MSNIEKIYYFNEILEIYLDNLDSNCYLDLCTDSYFKLIALTQPVSFHDTYMIKQEILEHLRLNTYYFYEEPDNTVTEIIVAIVVFIIAIIIIYNFHSPSSNLTESTIEIPIKDQDISSLWTKEETAKLMLSRLKENQCYKFRKDDGTLVEIDSMDQVYELLNSSELEVFLNILLSIFNS